MTEQNSPQDPNEDIDLEALAAAEGARPLEEWIGDLEEDPGEPQDHG